MSGKQIFLVVKRRIRISLSSKRYPGETLAGFSKRNGHANSFSFRKMVDKIPASSDLPGMMVLEPIEKTLWSARMRRPLSTREIKHIMRLALLGLREVHEKGLVYWGK